jgi:alpha-beta hydrolase superfamily lysophospholipase
MLLLLLVCTACATPQEQEHHIAQNPPMLLPHELVTTDKTHLPMRNGLPKGKVRAVIIALHGFNDYSHAFAIPSKAVNSHGIAIYAFDQRGFGNAVNKGIWPGQDNLIRDTGDMVRAARKKYPHIPIYLLGESMGGAIAVVCVTHPGFPSVDGVILSAPALWGGDTMNSFFRATLWFFAHTMPHKVLTGEDLHVLASDNIDMLRALGSDPYVIKETRVDAVYGLVHLMDTAYGNIDKVKEPTFILYGAHDQVIPPDPIKKAARKIKAPHIFAYYPLGYHMLLRDKHGDIPTHDIISWITDRNKPLPSGADKEGIKFLK